MVLDNKGAPHRFHHLHKRSVIILTTDNHQPYSRLSIQLSVWKLLYKLLQKLVMLPFVYELACPDHCHGLGAGDGWVIFFTELIDLFHQPPIGVHDFDAFVQVFTGDGLPGQFLHRFLEFSQLTGKEGLGSRASHSVRHTKVVSPWGGYMDFPGAECLAHMKT